jgi:hypothetical protein
MHHFMNMCPGLRNMNRKLSDSISHLYEVFSAYPLNPVMEASPVYGNRGSEHAPPGPDLRRPVHFCREDHDHLGRSQRFQAFPAEDA